MKHIGAIAGLLVCAALGVGAFVFASNDGSGSGRTAATVIKGDGAPPTTPTHTETAKPAVTPQVASDAPVLPITKKNDDDILAFHPDDKGELDGYEARKVFVGVSPSVVRAGREVELQVRGFGKFEVVVVSIGEPPFTITLTTDKQGRAKTKFTAPTVPGTYFVVAVGNQSGRQAGTALRVYKQK